jgi:hypothetical protein
MIAFIHFLLATAPLYVAHCIRPLGAATHDGETAMATEICTEAGEMVATRFFGGAEVGMVIQMEITREEFASWERVPVRASFSDHSMPFAAWVAMWSQTGAVVRWDTAARQHEIARAMESHRFADQVPAMAGAAAKARQRAKFISRSGIRAV